MLSCRGRGHQEPIGEVGAKPIGVGAPRANLVKKNDSSFILSWIDKNSKQNSLLTENQQTQKISNEPEGANN